MARVRRKKATTKERKKKVAASRKARPLRRGTSDDAPPFIDTSSLDAANELVRRSASRRAAAIAAMTSQFSVGPPVPSPTEAGDTAAFAGEVLAGEGSLTAR